MYRRLISIIPCVPNIIFLCLDDVVVILRSQHDSYHKNKANIFMKKLKEQITARSIKVRYQSNSLLIHMLYVVCLFTPIR